MLGYWFEWNPNPYAFYIDWLGRPLAWYGVLFVSGIALGYWMISHMFTRYISERGEFTVHHVADWDVLTQRLKAALDSPKTPLHKLVSLLPKDVRKAIAKGGPHGAQTKAAIASVMEGANRVWAEKELQGALEPLVSMGARMADRLTWYVVLGTVLGARLGHVLFYEIGDYWQRPWDVFKIWEGGLASHGGALGVMLALWLALDYLRRYAPSMTLLRLFDFVAVPAALAACFIRLGNFVNQELVGTPTGLPWGVLFGNPADNGPLVPRHPVPLYDAFANLAIFLILAILWRKRGCKRPEGFLIGLFFVLCFTARFFIDFIKMPMESSVDTGWLQMGQWLSIPFVLVGVYLIRKARLLSTSSAESFSKPGGLD